MYSQLQHNPLSIQQEESSFTSNINKIKPSEELLITLRVSENIAPHQHIQVWSAPVSPTSLIPYQGPALLQHTDSSQGSPTSGLPTFCSLPIRCFKKDRFCPWGDIWQSLQTFFLLSQLGGWWKPGVMSKYPTISSPSQQKIIQPKMSAVLLLKIFALHRRNPFPTPPLELHTLYSSRFGINITSLRDLSWSHCLS